MTTIRARLLRAFTLAILIPSVATAVVATWLVRRQVNLEAQARVDSDLDAAEEIYQHSLDRLHDALRIHASRAQPWDPDPAALRPALEALLASEGLDLLTALDADGRVLLRAHAPAQWGDRLDDPVVRRAVAQRAPYSATAVLPLPRLSLDGAALAARAAMEIRPTPMALPGGRGSLGAGLALEAAAPILSADGRVAGVLLGAVLLNRDFRIVDKVRTTVGPAVSATIFQDDVRISTNVLGPDGQRATSTRASAEVARAVLGRGETWRGRAFVVDAWHLAAYAPLRDADGRAVGMLYVGTPEAPYVARVWRYLLLLLGITALGAGGVGVVAATVAGRISAPLRAMEEAAQAVAGGDYSRRVSVRSADEIGRLAESFNQMTVELARSHGELRAWGENLERKVAERTAELKVLHEQMAQQDKLASIGELAAGVAHEINNPNTFIRGNIAIVSEALQTILPILDGAARQDPALKIARLPYAAFREHIGVLVSDIAAGADKIMNIVADLKKFARHDEGRLEEEVDLNQVVASCLRLVHNQVKRHAKVQLDLAPALPKVVGNAQKLEQVLVNLLLNAAQAIEERGDPGLIAVSTAQLADGRLALSVKDDGVGMTDEVKRRLFDPFFTTKRHRHGTGLGLSISYGIVSEHRGTLEVTSAQGQGALFRVLLPAPARAAASQGGG